MPGKKGWRSPLPDWWVDEVNLRLARRKLDKKQLARALEAEGKEVSEMMVLRALHPAPDKRIATIETIDAIADALRLPRPIVVAASLTEALELQSVVAFSAADATRLRIESEIDREEALRESGLSGSDGADGRKTRTTGSVVGGRDRSAGARSRPLRGTTRTR